MLDKVLVGTLVWLVSNETGRKTAKTGIRILSRIGGYAVNAMPKPVSDIFVGMDGVIKDIVLPGAEKGQEE